VAALLPADAILLGEQHDAPGHQEVHRQVVQALAARNVLAALAIEMAEQGHSTAGLPRGASEASVKAALAWDDDGWPWSSYAPAVMAAVRAGVAVIGANLPRAQLRAAMADAALDTAVSAGVLQTQREAVRDGHCGLLPESQIAPMARAQIARDRAMAQAVTQAIVPGKTVVLLAGAGHVDEEIGVPRHLPSSLRARAEPLPPEAPKRDYCAQLREQFKGGAARP
jgi:uncharacterized iron-regulated protein